MPKHRTPGLTPKQERFCEEYIVDRNGAAAARRAGYSEKNAKESAHELLGHPLARARIEELSAAQATRTQVTADRVIEELGRIAFLDIRGAYNEDGSMKRPHELPEDLARAIAGIEADEISEVIDGTRIPVGYTRKLKPFDKTAALIALGRHFKLFTDKVEHSGKVTLEDLVGGSQAPTEGESK